MLERVPQYRYIIPELFGDENWHNIDNLESIGLTKKDPTKYYIGINTEFESGKKVCSKYYWIYYFTYSHGSDWYYSKLYQAATPPVTDSDLQTVGGTRYLDVLITNGQTIYIPKKFRLTTTSNTPRIYFDSSYTGNDDINTGCIVSFGSSFPNINSFILPNDMYSIACNKIIWHKDHPLYKLYDGKEYFFVD